MVSQMMCRLGKMGLTPDIVKAGLRAAAAGSIAYVLAQSFALQQGYWSVVTAIIVMQLTLGASLEAATDRLVGSLTGAAVGFVLAYLTPSTKIGTL